MLATKASEEVIFPASLRSNDIGDPGAPIGIGDGKRPDKDSPSVPRDEGLIRCREHMGEKREKEGEEREDEPALRLPHRHMPDARQQDCHDQNDVGMERPFHGPITR